MYYNVSCIRFTSNLGRVCCKFATNNWGKFAAQSYGLNCEFFSAQFYMSEKCHVNLFIIKV